MGNRCALTGGTDWQNGESPVPSADINATQDIFAPAAMLSGSVYAGTGFDTSQTGSGSDTDNHTIQISAANLRNATYLYVNITFKATATGGDNFGTAELHIERQETGNGGFSDVIPDTEVIRANDGEGDACMQTVIGVVTLTSGEKANGIDIKITSTSSGGVNGASTFSNIQTFFRASH